jgi:hypothetical protein
LLKEVREKQPRTPLACAHPIRHRPWPEPRDSSPDLLEHRAPRQETKVEYGCLPKSAYGGKVVIDRAYWFGLDCACRPEPKLDGLSTLALREEMRNQPDETLLTHWQDELERTQGDLKLAMRVPLEARRRLAEKYQFIVYRPNRDYMQAANEALPRCINTCKPSKSFKTFARPAISHAIRDYKQSKESGESGAVYRPKDSDDSFKYPSKWYQPGQKAMLLASEVTDGDGGSDLSFDCRY